MQINIEIMHRTKVFFEKKFLIALKKDIKYAISLRWILDNF